MDLSNKMFGNNQTKKDKNSTVKKLACFFLKINFRVMKTFRNQVKYPKGLQLPILLQKEINNWSKNGALD